MGIEKILTVTRNPAVAVRLAGVVPYFTNDDDGYGYEADAEVDPSKCGRSVAQAHCGRNQWSFLAFGKLEPIDDGGAVVSGSWAIPMSVETARAMEGAFQEAIAESAGVDPDMVTITGFNAARRLATGRRLASVTVSYDIKVASAADADTVAANAGESDDAPALLQKAAVKLYKNDATVQALLKADGLDLEELDTVEVVVEEPTVVKTASNLKTRQCFKGGVNWRNGVVKAEGDFLDHVLVVYGGSYGANGVYLQNAENNFVKEDGSWTLDWKGCQWVLKRVSVVVNVTCADDIPAANELFGNSFIGGAKYASSLGFGQLESGKYDEDLCNAAAAKGFCAHKVFAAVCPGTCYGPDEELASNCTEDNNEALAMFAKFQGDPATKCAQAAHACHDSLVVNATCKRTCQTASFVGKEHDGEEYSHDVFDEHFGVRRMLRHDMRSDAKAAFRRLHFEEHPGRIAE